LHTNIFQHIEHTFLFSFRNMPDEAKPLYVPLQFWYAKDPLIGQFEHMAPLMAAVEDIDTSRLAELLSQKGFVNSLDSVGRPVLSGIMPTAPWVFGVTPLMLACQIEFPAHFAQSAAMLRLLPGVEKDLLSCTCTGQTPLHYAAQYGLEEVVHWWLNCGEPVCEVLHMRDNNGDTPLALAQRHGHHAVAAALTAAAAALPPRV
jgi:hypothetical protein